MKRTLLALSIALAGCADSDSLPTPKTAETGAKVLPDCAWQVKSNIARANWALPNTGTVYWAYVYELQPGESLVLEGEYPGTVTDGEAHWTRFFSLQTYTAKALPAEGDFPAMGAGSRVATLYDADIRPLPGSSNPYAPHSVAAQSASTAPTTPGQWRVTVSADAVSDPATPAQGDVMAAYPRPAGHKPYGSRGTLMLRYYLPVDGYPLTADSANQGGVSLPVITHVNAQGEKRVVSACYGFVRSLVASRVKPGEIKTPPVGFQDNGPVFVRPLETDGVYPNAANRYLYAAAVYDARLKDRMIRIRGKMPSTPKTLPAPYDGRDQPVVKPGSDGYDMRYWSVFVNKDEYPYPGVLGGGAQDSDVKLDARGYYTVVISKPEDRPVWWNDPGDPLNTTINWVNWTDNDSIGPRDAIGILLRNLLPSNDFAHSVDRVIPGSSPDEARKVMGDYYPEIDRVSAADFQTRS